ncbi:hypothetical protein DPM19_32495 [Actinomadura craniellae]|uniref:Mce-associated membrane protein n=1 Tax=Actinomadura craniellae TaxID=2231787 RepID=A0A365GWC8_9ACTN|nr:hypothetical protein DPM19_32495 [Actinomadura craniellae]
MPRVPTGPVAQLVLAAVIALAAVVLLVQAGQQRETSPAVNRALLDDAATTRVTDSVGDALTRIFSYSPTDTAATERAAAEVLSGRAAEQYRRLFGQVKQQAPAQRLTLTTRVVRTGVTDLSADTAQLLVFLDQVSTRNGRPNGTVAAAQLSVTAKLMDGRWKITDLRSS